MGLPAHHPLVFAIGVLLALGHIYANTLGTLPDLWVALFHFGGFGLLCALTVPVLKQRAGRLWSALSVTLGIGGVASCLWLGLQESALNTSRVTQPASMAR